MASRIEKKNNFKRIAEARTNKILAGINLLGNLSNKSYYEYTKEQIDSIFEVIYGALEEQRTRFENKEIPKKKFRL